MKNPSIMRPVCLCFLFGTIALPISGNAQEQSSRIRLIETPTIIVNQDNKSSDIIRIRNDSKRIETIEIGIQDFVSKTTNAPLGAKILLSALEEKIARQVQVYRDTLAPGAIRAIKIDVTDLWDAGESLAKVENYGQEIGTIRALKYSFPFAVRFQMETPENPKISFRHDTPCRLILKNDDALNYQVRWEIEVAGKMIGGIDTLSRNSTAPIDIQAPEEWFSSSSTSRFREEEQDGKITLKYVPPAETSYLLWPVRTTLFKARLNYYSPIHQQIISTVVLFVILFVGGFCSLFVSQWVPNRLRRRDFQDQLSILATKTREVSYRIDSSLRVLVRVERQRLKELLSSRSTLFPEIVTVFNQASQGIAMLKRRINLLVNIDNIYRQMRQQEISNPPPSLMDRIDKNLQQAMVFLKATEPQEADLQTVQALVTEANTLLGRLNEVSPPFAQELAGRVKALCSDFAPEGPIRKTKSCEDICGKLSTPFQVLSGQFQDPAKITPDNCSWLDLNTAKLNLIRDYVELCEDDRKLQKYSEDHWEKRQKELLEQLSLQSWNALRVAAQLLQQIREGIFAPDIEKAIQAQAIGITQDPNVARPNSPLQFQARFNQVNLNGATARNRFVCVWSFDDYPGQEEGWVVSHYFPQKKDYTVTVSFKEPNGQEIKNGNDETIMICRSTKVEKDGTDKHHNQLVIESIRLVIILVVTLMALLTGAQEQLAKLDLIPGLIAVVILGFTSDQIKNLLTQSSQPTSQT